ncbi:MAG TPA: WD40 repeat domain-containing protein [Acidobacteriota bacterium]|nr:WD40 repeat domain-containing protein [Acidobacteriota bacterium]
MRISAEGGAPQIVVQGKPFNHVGCAGPIEGKAECVAGFIEGDEYVFHSIDPNGDASQELFRISHRAPFTKWALSRDGTRMAVVHNDDNTIRLFSVPSGEESQIEVEGWTNFEFVEWSADGLRLYVNAGFASAGEFPSLVVVEFDGSAQVLRKRPSEWLAYPAASPDGNYLAFVSMPFHGNVWLIKAF